MGLGACLPPVPSELTPWVFCLADRRTWSMRTTVPSARRTASSSRATTAPAPTTRTACSRRSAPRPGGHGTAPSARRRYCGYRLPLVVSILPDRAPQILDMTSSLEWNLLSSPKIQCSATGNPLPSHTSIELRKLDSTVLKVGPGDRKSVV